MKFSPRHWLFLRETICIVCIFLFINSNISQAKTKNNKYGFILQPLEELPIYTMQSIGPDFIYLRLFYEYRIHKDIAINTGTAYFMNTRAFARDLLEKRHNTFTDYFIVIPFAIKSYHISNKFYPYIGVELHLHLLTKEKIGSHEKSFPDNKSFTNISHLRAMCGIGYEFNFGLLIEIKYESAFTSSINKNVENIEHDTSGMRFFLGINCAKILEFSQTKAKN